MKYEWRKKEKHLYLPKEEPQLIEIPEHKFLTIEGNGNPNGPDFAERVGVLYSLAYGVRMMPRNGFEPEGYYEYTVYPLEGIWSISEDAKKKKTWSKEDLTYKIMIRQPDFVTENVAEEALKIVERKKPHHLLKEAKFETITDGLALQILHLGPYDDEPASFAKMNAYMEANGLLKRKQDHREIYLTDARKTNPDKQKTVLRYFVEKVN